MRERRLCAQKGVACGVWGVRCGTAMRPTMLMLVFVLVQTHVPHRSHCRGGGGGGVLAAGHVSCCRYARHDVAPRQWVWLLRSHGRLQLGALEDSPGRLCAAPQWLLRQEPDQQRRRHLQRHRLLLGPADCRSERRHPPHCACCRVTRSWQHRRVLRRHVSNTPCVPWCCGVTVANRLTTS